MFSVRRNVEAKSTFHFLQSTFCLYIEMLFLLKCIQRPVGSAVATLFPFWDHFLSKVKMQIFKISVIITYFVLKVL